MRTLDFSIAESPERFMLLYEGVLFGAAVLAEGAARRERDFDSRRIEAALIRKLKGISTVSVNAQGEPLIYRSCAATARTLGHPETPAPYTISLDPSQYALLVDLLRAARWDMGRMDDAVDLVDWVLSAPTPTPTSPL